MKLSLPRISTGSCLLALAAGVILPAPATHANPMTFVANLSGANENPVIPSPGTGLATIVLDPTAQTLQVTATFSGLTSNDVAAHIHCCQAMPGTNDNDARFRQVHRVCSLEAGRVFSAASFGGASKGTLTVS